MLWRCRRGLLELDIVLERFIKQYFDGLTAAQLQAFDALLDTPDNQLWDMVTGRQHSDEPETRAMLELLQSTAVRTAKVGQQQAMTRDLISGS